MNTLIRRPVTFNPASLASFLGDVTNLSSRAFENFMAPYRLSKEDGRTIVSVDLAGFSKYDIHVALDESNRVLSISAEVNRAEGSADRPEGEDEMKKSASEKAQGFYDRKVNLTFTMPDHADYESLESHYSDGVLKVSFATKTAETIEPRQIVVR